MRDELAGEVLFMISLMFKHRDGLSSIVCTCNPNQTHCDQHIEPTLSSLLPSEQHPSSKHKAISKNLHHHQRNKQPSIHTPPNTRSQSRLTIHALSRLTHILSKLAKHVPSGIILTHEQPAVVPAIRRAAAHARRVLPHQLREVADVCGELLLLVVVVVLLVGPGVDCKGW